MLSVATRLESRAFLISRSVISSVNAEPDTDIRQRDITASHARTAASVFLPTLLFFTCIPLFPLSDLSFHPFPQLTDIHSGILFKHFIEIRDIVITGFLCHLSHGIVFVYQKIHGSLHPDIRKDLHKGLMQLLLQQPAQIKRTDA